MTAHICHTCGKGAYMAHARGGCPECRGVSAKEAPSYFPPESITCAGCGVQFRPKSVTQRHCSDRCRKPHAPLPEQRACAVCGDMFTPRNADTRYRTCSRPCREEYHRRINRELMRQRRTVAV